MISDISHVHVGTSVCKHTPKIARGMDRWVKVAVVSTAPRDTPRSPWSLTRASGLPDILFLPGILLRLAQLWETTKTQPQYCPSTVKMKVTMPRVPSNIFPCGDEGRKGHSLPLPHSLNTGTYSRQSLWDFPDQESPGREPCAPEPSRGFPGAIKFPQDVGSQEDRKVDVNHVRLLQVHPSGEFPPK